jgi:GxxExxY protein
VERQKVVPLVYQGKRAAGETRIDLLAETSSSWSAKRPGRTIGLFEAQRLTYLWPINLKLGLAIHFGKRLVKDGIHRVVKSL